MIRPLGYLLLTLSFLAVLAPRIAQAQAPEAEAGPFQSLFGLFQHQSRVQPESRESAARETLPPPGFASSYDAPPVTSEMTAQMAPQMGPQSGHQFIDRAPVAASPAAAQPADDAMRPPGAIGGMSNAGSPQAPSATYMSLPPEDQPEQGQPKELPPNLKKQLVDYATKEPAGTIIVDTPNTYLYLVLGGGKALRYGVRVGREGFTWAGTERVSKMKEWPDWHPPAEMIERQPYLPRFMAGGDGNPLGARALYLGKTLYRIHGTNQPSTIGKTVSSGCVGMLNSDIEDLYSRVQVGSRVVVLPGKEPDPNTVANAAPPAPANPMAPPSVNAAPLPPPINPPIMSGSMQPPMAR